jgi:tetratricopeptide (TPR) repeat protein
MLSRNGHPTPEKLGDFAAGRLGPDEIGELASHLDTCERCCEELNALTAGSMEGRLRRAARPSQAEGPEGSYGPPRTEFHPPPPRDDGLPHRVGRYRVEEVIARGGMGRIVRVRDDDFQRPLAMKVVLSRDPRLAERFLHEARLTGRLQHPGIPPVHELGHLPDGSPYFIMKLIQGRTLSALLRERQDSGADLTRLLGIFGQICQTVGYAHSRGVIHRDLKPLNIMVGAFGEVQVMDWGLAKVLDVGDGETPSPEAAGVETSFDLRERGGETPEATLPGSVLGTPAYMAPEQARGEVDRLDARCDVFGLGGILCEVLTGKPPFVGGDVRARAARADLDDAHARLSACGADAEVVALARRCLAALPEDRPANGAAVAEAVAAHQAELQRRLMQAERDRAAAEARAAEEGKRREVERQRRTMAVWAARLLAAVAVVTIVGIGAFFWAYSNALKQKMKADEETARASSHLDSAVQTADITLNKVIRQFKPLAGIQSERVRQILEDIRPIYDRLIQDAGEQPDLLVRKAGLLSEMASVYQLMADVRTAEASSRQADELYLQAIGEGPGRREWIINRAANLYRLALILGDQRRITDAMNVIQSQLRLAESLCQAKAGDIESQLLRLEGRWLCGALLSSQEDYFAARKEAAPALAEAKKLLKSLGPDNGSDVRVRCQQAVARLAMSLADVSDGWETVEDRRDLYNEAVLHFKSLVEKNPGNADLERLYANAQFNLTFLVREESPDQARKILTEILSRAERQLRLDPRNIEWLRLKVGARNFLVDMVDDSEASKPIKMEKLKEQIQEIEGAISLSDPVVKQYPDHRGWSDMRYFLNVHLGATHLGLARLEVPARRPGHLRTAEKLFKDAEAYYEAQLPKRLDETAALHNLAALKARKAMLLYQEGKMPQAMGLMASRSQPIVDYFTRQRKASPESPSWAWGLAQALRDRGSSSTVNLGGKGGEKDLRESLALFQELQQGHPEEKWRFLREIAESSYLLWNEFVSRERPDQWKLYEECLAHYGRLIRSAPPQPGIWERYIDLLFVRITRARAQGKNELIQAALRDVLNELHVQYTRAPAYRPGNLLERPGDSRLRSVRAAGDAITQRQLEGRRLAISLSQQRAQLDPAPDKLIDIVREGMKLLEVIGPTTDAGQVEEVRSIISICQKALKDLDGRIKHPVLDTWSEAFTHTLAILPKVEKRELSQDLARGLKGSLSPKDPLDSFAQTNKSHYKVHDVPMQAGKSYLIDLSAEFNTFLRLEDSLKVMLLFNDDVCPPDNTNSRLVFTPSRNGTYRVIVTSVKPGATGAYTLRVVEVARADKEVIFKGGLSKKSRTIEGRYFEEHKVVLLGGQPCTVLLESSQFDTFLWMKGPDGKLITLNDDIFPGSTSASRIDFTPRADGEFTILASSSKAGEAGDYTLTIEVYKEKK